MAQYPEVQIRTTIALPEMERLEALLKRHNALMKELDENFQEIAAARTRLEIRINQPALER